MTHGKIELVEYYKFYYIIINFTKVSNLVRFIFIKIFNRKILCAKISTIQKSEDRNQNASDFSSPWKFYHVTPSLLSH